MVLSEVGVDEIHLSSELSSDEENENTKEQYKKHKQLLKDIGVKPRKKRKSVRNEPTQDVSEFTWSTGKDPSNKLELHELVGTLPSSKQPVAKLKKKLRKMENTVRKLEKPLTKPETQKIERTVAYQDTATEVSKWNPIIQKNREAEQLIFPMNQYKPPPMSTPHLVNSFKPQNDLEKEISAVLKGSQHLLERDGKELTEAEETALRAFDLEEALERRKELQRARALQSYYEAKCRRQKKIKSKKYHRILKKEQQKALSKVDLETLSEDNPEVFKTELEKAEKMRALERANLRHRNTSKWAKNMIVKGHKTKEDQEVVREQLRISRQLTEHKTVVEDDDEDVTKAGAEENTTVNIKLLEKTSSDSNPWLLGATGDSQHPTDGNTESSTKYQKLKPIVTAESKKYDEYEKEAYDDVISSGEEWNQTDEKIEHSAKKKKKLKTQKKKRAQAKGEKVTAAEEKQNVPIDFESDQEYEGVKENEIIHENKQPVAEQRRKATILKNSKEKQEANTLRFLREDKDAVEMNFHDQSSDEEIVYDSEQRMNIREAFANDDVIGDFLQEKEEISENSKPKPEDLTLPGWGEWGGAGLTVSKKKRKRFAKDAGPPIKRKDDGKANVILSEMRNEKLAKLQLQEVPFPYSNQMEFERSIRQPIGEQWNTPSVHSKLIEPRIRTLAGNIINPLKPSKRLKKKFRSTKSEI